MIVRIAFAAACLITLPTLAQEAAADATTRPTTQPATTPLRPALELERAEWRAMMRHEQADMLKAADMPRSKLLSIELDGGHLHVKPRLGPTGGMVKFELTDWPGYAQAAVGPADSPVFNFIHTDLAWRDAVVVRTTVMAHVDYLQIARDIGWPGDERSLSVQLIQSRQFADEDGNPIRLIIQYLEVGNDNDEDKPSVDQHRTISATSFEQLRMKHPREVRAYLLPILRDLGAAQLVKSTDPNVVWQVLGEAVPGDPKLQQQIDALLQQIDTGDFKTRTAAEEKLMNLGPEAASMIARMDLSKLAPDPRMSAENTIRRWQPLPADQVGQMARNVNFLIDAIELDADPRLTAAAVEALEKVLGKKIDLAPTLSPAQREERLEALRPPLSITPATQPAD